MALRGLCPAMCPPAEISSRDRYDVNVLEMAYEENGRSGQMIRRIDPLRAVKQYRRAAAGRKISNLFINFVCK